MLLLEALGGGRVGGSKDWGGGGSSPLEWGVRGIPIYFGLSSVWYLFI